jgi:hypothetical protein
VEGAKRKVKTATRAGTKPLPRPVSFSGKRQKLVAPNACFTSGLKR